jgi:hypothetical protein
MHPVARRWPQAGRRPAHRAYLHHSAAVSSTTRLGQGGHGAWAEGFGSLGASDSPTHSLTQCRIPAADIDAAIMQYVPTNQGPKGDGGHAGHAQVHAPRVRPASATPKLEDKPSSRLPSVAAGTPVLE